MAKLESIYRDGYLNYNYKPVKGDYLNNITRPAAPLMEATVALAGKMCDLTSRNSILADLLREYWSKDSNYTGESGYTNKSADFHIVRHFLYFEYKFYHQNHAPKCLGDEMKYDLKAILSGIASKIFNILENVTVNNYQAQEKISELIKLMRNTTLKLISLTHDRAIDEYAGLLCSISDLKDDVVQKKEMEEIEAKVEDKNQKNLQKASQASKINEEMLELRIKNEKLQKELEMSEARNNSILKPQEPRQTNAQDQDKQDSKANLEEKFKTVTFDLFNLFKTAIKPEGVSQAEIKEKFKTSFNSIGEIIQKVAGENIPGENMHGDFIKSIFNSGNSMLNNSMEKGKAKQETELMSNKLKDTNNKNSAAQNASDRYRQGDKDINLDLLKTQAQTGTHRNKDLETSIKESKKDLIKKIEDRVNSLEDSINASVDVLKASAETSKIWTLEKEARGSSITTFNSNVERDQEMRDSIEKLSKTRDKLKNFLDEVRNAQKLCEEAFNKARLTNEKLEEAAETFAQTNPKEYDSILEKYKNEYGIEPASAYLYYETDQIFDKENGDLFKDLGVYTIEDNPEIKEILGNE